MVEVYSPNNESELAIIKTVLESDAIPFFVRNDHFGTLRIGPLIELLNRKAIMVDVQHEIRAKELISHFIPDKYHVTYSLFDKLRMIIEVFLFGWFIPGGYSKGIVSLSTGEPDE